REVRIAIVIPIVSRTLGVDGIAVAAFRDVFVFIHLFLNRLLSGASAATGRINITNPTLILSPGKKQYEFAFTSIHVVVHLPKPSVDSGLAGVLAPAVVVIVCSVFLVKRIPWSAAFEFEVKYLFRRCFGCFPAAGIQFRILLFKLTLAWIPRRRSAVPKGSSRHPSHRGD